MVHDLRKPGTERGAPIQYIVEGGHRLAGTIAPSGNKNAALPIIAAALLTEHPVMLDNVPRIRDIETLVELIRSVGAAAEWRERNTLADPRQEHPRRRLDPELCARIRASILLAGPLLARCGEREPAAARRRRDRPAAPRYALPGARSSSAPTLPPRDRLRIPRAAAHGRRRLPRRAQRDRHRERVDGGGGRRGHHRSCATPPASRTCRTSRDFLVAMGAKHRGHRHQHAWIEGGPHARRRQLRIGPDHIEVGSLDRARRGDPLARSAIARAPAWSTCARSGWASSGSASSARSRATTSSCPPIRRCEIQHDLGGHVPKLEDQPWPAFPADLMSIAIVAATQCDGVILMFEKMFESRMFFVDKLVSWARGSCCAIRTARSSPGRAGCAARRCRVPRHPRRHGDAAGRAVREGDSTINNAGADRARLRAHRRATECARGADHPRAGAHASDVGQT